MAIRWSRLDSSYYSYNLLIVLLISLVSLTSMQNIVAADHVRGTSPLILSQNNGFNHSENTLSAFNGDNVRFKCISDEPIHWHLPRNYSMANFNITQLVLQKQNVYETHLQLFDVNHEFVGFYYCVKNASTDSNLQTQFQNNLVSKVYLFVDSSRHRINNAIENLEMEKDPLYRITDVNIQVRDNCDVFVPCKSTSNARDARLIQTQPKSEMSADRIAEYIVKYRYGYLVKNVNLTEGKNEFECSRGDAQQTITIDVERTELRLCPQNLVDYETFDEFKYVNEVTISSKTDNFGIEGSDLQLNCSFHGLVGGGYNIKWQLPNDNIEKQGRMTVEFGFGTSRLTVYNVDRTNDAGVYKCIVEVGDRSYTESLNLNNILGARDSFLNIIAPSIVQLEDYPKRTHIPAKYSGYPTPNVTWRDAHGKDILMDGKEPYFAVVDDQNQFTRISFDDSDGMSVEFGNYSLYAYNSRMQKEALIQLTFAPKKPIISINYEKIDDEIEVICIVQGKPKSQITLEACNEANTCVRIDSNPKLANHKQTMRRIFHDSLVNVTCFADNTFEKNQLSAHITVLDSNLLWIIGVAVICVVVLLIIVAICCYRNRNAGKESGSFDLPPTPKNQAKSLK